MISPEERHIAPEAVMEELPPVLADPPWLRKKKKVKAPTFILQPLGCPDLEAVSDELKKEHQPTIDRFQKQGLSPRSIIDYCVRYSFDNPLKKIAGQCLAAIEENQPETLVDLWLKALRKNDPGSFRIHLMILDQLSPEFALAVWNDTAAWYDEVDYVEPFLVKHGLSAKKGFVDLFEKQPVAYASFGLAWGFAELAPGYARIFTGQSKNARIADQWFGRFPEQAACGLLYLALGGDKKENKDAEKALSFWPRVSVR